MAKRQRDDVANDLWNDRRWQQGVLEVAVKIRFPT